MGPTVSILLSSSLHVATVCAHRYLTPLYCIWEFPVTQNYTAGFILVNCKSHKPSVACVSFPALVYSNFNCCSNPSSRWQRHRIKPLLFKSTILAYTSLMSQLWANMNTLQVHRSLWMDIQSKRALFLCQLSVAEYTQPYTIWGTYTLYVPQMVHNCGWPYYYYYYYYII